MAVIMAALVIALPASATGASSTFTPGEIIYCENFSNVPDTDDLSVIEASLGYKVVAVDTSTLDYTMTEKNISAAIKYSVKDGKLCVDNTADDCAYSYLYIYDSDSMKDLVKTTYTVQYEITYVAGPTAYCSPILNWDGEFTHQVPMFRGNGTYRNQVKIYHIRQKDPVERLGRHERHMASLPYMGKRHFPHSECYRQTRIRSR